MDRIWAHVAEQCGMLPQYWNFKLQLLGIGLDTAPTPSLSKLPPSYGLYFLGSVWFYVLLVNAKQDVAEVYNEVAKAVDKIGTKDNPASENLLEHLPPAVFSPRNIFWHPNQQTVPAGWTTLWEGALNLGFLLLRHGMRPISKWSETEFWQKFEEAQVARSSTVDDKEAIHDILIKIGSKWRGDLEAKFSTSEKGAGDVPAQKSEIAQEVAGISEDLLTKETVILSPQNFGAKKRSDDELDETILLKPEDVAQAETSDSASQVEKDLPETVILARDVSETQRSTPEEPRGDDIPETVIISARESVPAQRNTDPKHSAEEDSPEPTKKGPSKKSKMQRPEKKPAHMKTNDDEIPETVIIDTKKLKNRQ
jgi:hypothetical protein